MLAKNLGIELEEHGFCKTEQGNPVQTSRGRGSSSAAPSAVPRTFRNVMERAAPSPARRGSSPHAGARDHRGGASDGERSQGDRPENGVFVCHCGINIGGRRRCPRVVEYAKTLPNVVYATDNLLPAPRIRPSRWAR